MLLFPFLLPLENVQNSVQRLQNVYTRILVIIIESEIYVSNDILGLP